MQRNNNYNNAKFGMQKSTDDVLGILAESVVIFIRSSRVFTKLLELWAKSIEKSIQSPNVFS
jgi:hypothetical protein